MWILTQLWKIKIWPSKIYYYKVFIALFVPTHYASIKSNIPVPFLECLSICQDNREPTGNAHSKICDYLYKRKANINF